MTPPSCKACRARIKWARTWEKGRQLALNPRPSTSGTVRIAGLDDEEELRGELRVLGFTNAMTGVRVGAAVVLEGDELAAAVALEWELYVPHRHTCPARERRDQE